MGGGASGSIHHPRDRVMLQKSRYWVRQCGLLTCSCPDSGTHHVAGTQPTQGSAEWGPRGLDAVNTNRHRSCHCWSKAR